MGRPLDDLKAIASAWYIPLPHPNQNDAAITLYRVVSMSGELSRTLAAVLAENSVTPPFQETPAALLERYDQPALEKVAARWHIPDLRYMQRAGLIETLATLLAAKEARERM